MAEGRECDVSGGDEGEGHNMEKGFATPLLRIGAWVMKGVSNPFSMFQQRGRHGAGLLASAAEHAD
jgi:hypothetical protein